MKSWTLKFLAGAMALFLSFAPSPAEADLEAASPETESMSAMIPCEGSGCRPALAWVCVIRSGEDCEEAHVFVNKCNIGYEDCDTIDDPVTPF